VAALALLRGVIPLPEAIFMVRKLLFLLALFFSISISARAQGSNELFVGYSYEHLGTSPSRNINGVEGTFQRRFLPWIGLVGDVDAHFGLPSQLDARDVHFMAGPEISLPIKISPFFHVMGGFGHIHENGLTSTSFATAFGGGIDYHLAPLFAWRVFQADDVITQFFGATEHSVRISTGLVFRF
jgi:hypothetical protein